MRLVATRQASDAFESCRYDLDSPSDWHELDPSLIEAACTPDAAPPALCRPTVDADSLADALQDTLRSKIAVVRRSLGGLDDTRFDRKL